MEFNNNVISQGIVLASILAGFGLATTAQIALSSDPSSKRRSLAHIFITSSIFSITAAILGMIAMGFDDRTNQYRAAVIFYGLCLMFSLFGFVLGIDALVNSTPTPKNTDLPLILSLFARISLAVVMVLFLLLILTSTDFLGLSF